MEINDTRNSNQNNSEFSEKSFKEINFLIIDELYSKLINEINAIINIEKNIETIENSEIGNIKTTKYNFNKETQIFSKINIYQIDMIEIKAILNEFLSALNNSKIIIIIKINSKNIELIFKNDFLYFLNQLNSNRIEISEFRLFFDYSSDLNILNQKHYFPDKNQQISFFQKFLDSNFQSMLINLKN